MSNLYQEIEQHGYAYQHHFLSQPQLGNLLNLITQTVDQSMTAADHAARNLLWNCPQLAPILAEAGFDKVASAVLKVPAFIINALCFDKTPEANWKVPSHQDLMMPVEQQEDEASFGGWRVKAGVTHVEPPVNVLANLVALRLHFDDCRADNGALSVIAGSHRQGKLPGKELAQISHVAQFTICEASAGDLFLMKPFLIHKSAPAASPSHRRVLHLVYAHTEPGLYVRWKRA